MPVQLTRRLTAQQLARPAFATPRAVVSALGAVQAQDWLACLWAVGMRLSRAATEGEIVQAVSDGELIRIHALRGTWQFIAPQDVRWMLDLVGAAEAAAAKTRHDQLGLDEATFRKSNAALEAALRDGAHLTRDEVKRALAKRRIRAEGPRLMHLLWRAELDQVICNGRRAGKQSTYAAFELRVPKAKKLTRDEAIAELARRYFTSRGPATVGDFTWWSGLPAAEARRGLEAVRRELCAEGPYFSALDAKPAARGEYLVPAFDEFLVAYRDRDGVLDPKYVHRLNAGGGFLGNAVISAGRVVGTWRRSLGRRDVSIDVSLFQKAPRDRIEKAAARYAEFLGLEPKVRMGRR